MAVVSKLARCKTILRWAVISLSALLTARVWAQPAGEVLTNASQIRNLAFAEASHSLPTKLRGVVVTEAGPPGNRAVVISDGTAGIYLLGATNIFAGVH